MLITTILLYRVATTRWIAARFRSCGCRLWRRRHDLSRFNSLRSSRWLVSAIGGARPELMHAGSAGRRSRQRLQEMSMPLKPFIDNIDTIVVARPPGMGV
jgi:KUP system potassium uptake protein